MVRSTIDPQPTFVRRVALFGCLLATVLTPRAAANEVRVYVLAGGSNGLGYGVDAALLPPDLSGPQKFVPFWFEDGFYTAGPWLTSNGTLVPLHPQIDPTGIVFGGVNSGFGPELSAGSVLADVSPEPIAIVKVCSDGSSLALHWNPDATGLLFDRMIDAVKGAEHQLQLLGYTPVLSGFFWMQGEIDAQHFGDASSYGQHLGRFIMRTRQLLDAWSLRFVLGRPNSHIVCGPFGCFPYLSNVRNAESVIAHTVPEVVLVDTDDLAIQPDGVHFTAASQVDLGRRFATKLLAQ
jgi:hypothetical protein